MSSYCTLRDASLQPQESRAAMGSELDGFRGLLYSLALSLIFVWAPLLYIFF